MKRFLYLFQVEQDLPSALEAAAGPDSDIRFLSWRARSADSRSIYYPSSSWTQGRNRLLKEALRRDYLYVVFGDDDITLELTERGVTAAGPQANPWRVFEDFLLTYEPAVGCSMYSWHLSGGAYDPTQDCQTLRFFDAILNAFHRESLEVLLPYYDLLDEETECYSQSLLCSLAADLYAGHVMQTNRLIAANDKRRRTDLAFVLCKPEQLYLESLRDAEWARRFARQGVGDSARFPTMGPPRRKTASFARTDEELARHYDLSHLLWTRRRALRALPVTDEFYSDSADSPRAFQWRAARPRPAALPAPAIQSRFALPHPWRLPAWTRSYLQKPAVRAHPLFLIARDLYRGRGRPRAIAEVLGRMKSRLPARGLWRRWYRTAGAIHEIPEARQQEVLELLAFALNELADPSVVFVDVGAGRGDVLHALRCTDLHKRLFALGIDPIDLRGQPSYTGYVQAAITDGPEGHAELFRYASSDCSSLKRMDPTKVTHDPALGGDRLYYTPTPIERLEEMVRVPTFHLSTIIRQYGLANDVLHFVKIDAQGSDLDVFRSLGEMSSRCLFLRMETVCHEGEGPAPTLYEGQTTFAEDRAALEAAGFRLFNIARFGSTPEADVTFVNVRLFRELLPALAR
ncbi:MAG: FkbM family methyltransferase [Gemmatimonadaceae bacterium]|jgi:hypothetical protein